MELTPLLTSYGIQPANISPEVREGLNAILRVAGREALAQVQAILKAEAAKRGVVVGGPTPAQQQDSARAALEAAQKAQAEAEAKKKRQRIIIGVVAGVVLIGGVVIYLFTKKR